MFIFKKNSLFLFMYSFSFTKIFFFYQKRGFLNKIYHDLKSKFKKKPKKKKSCLNNFDILYEKNKRIII